MKEIGGYLEFEHYRGEHYLKAAYALNSGRASLGFILRMRGIKKLIIPDFLCDAISQYCDYLGVAYRRYSVCDDLSFVFPDDIADDEWLYVVDYYGQLDEATVANAKRLANSKVIIDEAQNFFVTQHEGVDAIFTCRKFFGVADGGFAVTNCVHADVAYSRLAVDKSHDRMHFLLGRFEEDASSFFAQYQENEENFVNRPPMRMSLLTSCLLGMVDYNYVKARRNENFALLHKLLGEHNRLDLTLPVGAYMYPLFVHDGASARQHLIERKIYIPTLWPNVLNECNENSAACDLARNILPLPVDQRYDGEDMRYLADAVLECIR